MKLGLVLEIESSGDINTRKVRQIVSLGFVCLFVLTDAQEKQIEIATPGKRASHRLGYSSYPEHLISTQLYS